MKFAVSSYSFAKLQAQGVTQLSCIRLARELGYDGMEIAELQAPEGVSPADYALQLAAEAKKQALPLVNFCTGANFAQQGAAWEAEVAAVKQKVDLAALLGVPTLRHDAAFELGPFATFGQALPAVAAGCRAVTEYAAKKGIRTMVENHGFFFQEPERMDALYHAVGHPNFGLLADMGNFLCADCEPAAAYSRLREEIFLAHAKDFLVKPCQGPKPGEGFFRSRGGNYLRGTIIGHGVVPVSQCLYILNSIGYDGWVSVEFEGMEDCLTALRIDLENLRQYSQAL